LLNTEQVLSRSLRRADTEACHYRAVERVISAMPSHLDEGFSLEEMADEAFMSPFHFTRVFHQLIGVPPRHFLSAVRLEAAKRLLLTTELSVTDVCFAVGYNSLGTFTHRFSQRVGLSPRDFRHLDRRRSLEVKSPLRADVQRANPSDPCIEGTVEDPAGTEEPVLLGVFGTAIPQGHPLACEFLPVAGAFRLPHLPDRDYFVFAATLACIREPSRGRVASAPLRVSAGRAAAPLRLHLRPPQVTDPPILICLPLLIRGEVLDGADQLSRRVVEMTLPPSGGRGTN
jgi:AraC family transcriptional regulator